MTNLLFALFSGIKSRKVIFYVNLSISITSLITYHPAKELVFSFVRLNERVFI